MRKYLFIGLILSSSWIFAETISIKNNQDLELTLSQTNYNRLVIKKDRIIEAVFPEQAMVVKRDEQDGSIYLLLTTPNPFTLFLTIESGQHLSATIHGEESLGKTIELIANKPIVQTKVLPKPSINPTLISLIEHMKTNQPLAHFKIEKKRVIERWKQGLSLMHQQVWHGNGLTGEIIELYNGGHKPLLLDEGWFSQDNTRAIQLSQPQLLPHQSALLYRVNAHG